MEGKSVTILNTEQIAELANNFHLARVALCTGDNSRHARMIWACKAFHQEHPEVSFNSAYKNLTRSMG